MKCTRASANDPPDLPALQRSRKPILAISLAIVWAVNAFVEGSSGEALGELSACQEPPPLTAPLVDADEGDAGLLTTRPGGRKTPRPSCFCRRPPSSP